MDKNNKNETLVEAVMRRVEEFKAWRLKNSKTGFEEDYKDVLSQVENPPDSEKKFYAMADVLKLGYWYLSDGKTDEMRARLKEAAIKGHNKEVLALCIGFDADKYSGKEKVDYVYNTVIPELLQYGVTEGVAYQHYWLGYDYLEDKDFGNARKEFELALTTSAENPLYAALSRSILAILDGLGDRITDRSRHGFSSTSEELIRRGDRLYYSQQPGFSRQYMDVPNYAINAYAPLYYASRADRLIYDESMKAGDSITDSEGKITLTCVSTDATVTTPCGDFYGCVEMQTHNPKDRKYIPAPIFVAWYKRGIGLVAFGWKQADGEPFGITSLSAYTVNGGHGLIPLCEGNVWSYTTEGLDCEQVNRVTVTAVEGDRAYLSYCHYVKGHPFDEHAWSDNLLFARNNYYKGETAVDVSVYYDRARALAVTPWEKKLTEVSQSVMSRIYAGDRSANPDSRQSGHWNFFLCYRTREENGKLTITDDRTYSFEWKDVGTPKLQSMLHNFIYEIIQDNLGALWNDEWLTYADKDGEFEFHRPAQGNNGQTFIGYAKVKSGVTLTTTLGTFQNCLHLRTHTNHADSAGWAYMSSDKDYYFAPGIGIVRIVSYITSYEDFRIYDLVSYEGTGEGHMPIREGLARHYRYVNAADLGESDVHAGASYYYTKDNDGKLVILGDQLGMLDAEKKTE